MHFTTTDFASVSEPGGAKHAIADDLDDSENRKLSSKEQIFTAQLAIKTLILTYLDDILYIENPPCLHLWSIWKLTERQQLIEARVSVARMVWVEDEGSVRPAGSKLPTIPMPWRLFAKTQPSEGAAEGEGRRRSVMAWGGTGAEAVGHGVERGTETFSPIRSLRSMFDLARDLPPEEEEQQGPTWRVKSFRRIKSFRRRTILPRKPDRKEIMDTHEAATPPVLTGAEQGVCRLDNRNFDTPHDVASPPLPFRLKQSRGARDSSQELALAHFLDAATPPVLTGAKQGVRRLKSRSARDLSKELALAHASSKKWQKDAGRPDLHEFLGLEPPTRHQNTSTPHTAMLFRIRRLRKNRF